MSDVINQNTEPLFIFDMPDDETLAHTISVKGEKGDWGGATKTSELVNDSDFTTNAALNAGLATKADATTVQSLASQVGTNTSAIESLQAGDIEFVRANMGNGRWYKLTTLYPNASQARSASISLSGRIGDVSDNAAQVDITLTSRGNVDNSLTARGDLYAKNTNLPNWADIVAYRDADSSTFAVYLKLTSWVAVKLRVICSDCELEYDGTYATDEPSGTLAWSLGSDESIQKNIGGTILADINGDSATVNGHTVNADVPYGALFTDTIYDDSAIYSELNDKANATDVANTYATQSQLDTSVTTLETRIAGLTNGSPLVASSVSGMTDTTRIYVNTTDGNWYYYDGSTWTVGGAYQSTGVAGLTDSNMALGGITPISEKVYDGVDINASDVYRDYTTLHNGYTINPTSGLIKHNQGTQHNSYCFRIPHNAYIGLVKNTTTNRFRVALTNTNPISNDNVTGLTIFDDATATKFGFKNGQYSWVVVQTTSASESCTLNCYVYSLNNVKSAIHDSALAIMDSVAADDLYDPNNKVIGEGTKRADQNYQYTNAFANMKTYKFALTPNTTYTITRNGGDRFVVALWQYAPIALERIADDSVTGGERKLYSTPQKIVNDDASVTEVTFNSDNYGWCTILYSVSSADATFEITTDTNSKYRLARQYVEDYLVEKQNGGYIFDGEPNPDNDIWTQWNGRLAWGMYPNTAPVPAQFNGQLYANGTIITHNTFDRDHNRHRYHVFEAYSKDNYSRLTILLDKHEDEFNGKGSCEQYYYTGANHYASSYSYMKLGSDVKYHSFNFDRDEMIASGHIDCRFPVTLARISPSTDLDATYGTVAAADAAHEPENQAEANLKCLKYIYLKNAENGCMWYDADRNKVVVKINGKWHDVNTTEVPDGTYSF